MPLLFLAIILGGWAWAQEYLLEPVGTLVHLRIFLPLTVPQAFQLGLFRLRVESDLHAKVQLVTLFCLPIVHTAVYLGIWSVSAMLQSLLPYLAVTLA
jgi:hypothetical protein